jgi:hypothetical protein
MAHDIDSEIETTAGSEVHEDASRSAVVAAVTPAYLVTAYRWGCTNEHAYHVYAGIDRTKALACANAENADRGGKYGVVVWEFDSDGTDYKPIAYYGSSMEDDERKQPRHNHRIDFYERIGQFVNEAASGKALLPDPKNDKHMTYQEVEPLPDYILKEIERQRAFLAIWEKGEAARQPTNG